MDAIAGRGARPTQAQRRAQSEQRLLRAAAELVVEHGLAGTSLADIGRRAGYSHAVVNQRFGSKDGLIVRLGEATTAYFVAQLADAPSARDGLDELTRLATVYLEQIRGPEPIARVHVVLWSEAVARSGERRPVHVEWDRRFRKVCRRMIEAGIADGSVGADVAADESALAVVGLLRGIAMQLLLDPAAHGDEVVAALPELLGGCLRGGAPSRRSSVHSGGPAPELV